MATGTDTELEKPELTKVGKFCQRRGINSNLIMLKITLFVMYGGTYDGVMRSDIDMNDYSGRRAQNVYVCVQRVKQR